ncbi:hypothetical protein WG904_12410 [Pedobacter sp. Du54]|uniref:hypothetical protein n=1 Tax=Pedobacter anseongensis TaxID=3133439 RepID=UPI0030A96074
MARTFGRTDPVHERSTAKAKRERRSGDRGIGRAIERGCDRTKSCIKEGRAKLFP